MRTRNVSRCVKLECNCDVCCLLYLPDETALKRAFGELDEPHR